MKKKCVKAMALALTLAMIPVMAYGASSSPTNDSSSSSSSASNSGSTSVGGDGTSGTAVTKPTSPSIVVSSDGQQISVGQSSKDAAGVNMSLMVNTTTTDGQTVTMQSGGGAVIGDMVATIAVGKAETAGLPTDIVNAIDSLNKGTAPAQVFPNQDLTGYQKLGNTRAIVLTSQTTGKSDPVATEITMVVDGLKSDTQSVIAMYYDNATGRWVRVNAAFNVKTKTVTFKAPGSCTVQFLYK